VTRRDESRQKENDELKWLFFFQEKGLKGNCLKGLVKHKVQADIHHGRLINHKPKGSMSEESASI